MVEPAAATTSMNSTGSSIGTSSDTSKSDPNPEKSVDARDRSHGNGTGDTGDRSKIVATNEDKDAIYSLDYPFYYYQHPKTGTVSSSAFNPRQLCRLLCPVREGLAPILASHTRCLPMKLASSSENPTNSSQEEQVQPQTPSYGEWNAVSETPILKEAACQNWYYCISSSNGNAEETGSHGPVSCRTLLLQQSKLKPDQQLLVFSQDITEQWLQIDALSNLKLVLQALDQSNGDGSSQIDRATAIDNQSTQKSGTEQPIENDDDLEGFLSSTAAEMDGKNKDEDDFEYQSDGGTTYVKDPRTGNWIHEALVPSTVLRRQKDSSNEQPQTDGPSKKSRQGNTNNAKKKSKGPSFSKRNAKCWIYVTGLPGTSTSSSTKNNNSIKEESYESEVARYFAKAGLLDLDPETLKPKLKLYRDKDSGKLKGDASICYARPESVDLALEFLDGSSWDTDHILSVQRAEFQAKQSAIENDQETSSVDMQNQKRRRRPVVSEAKRKVAKLALLQAQDEGFGERLSGGRKGLKIVVVKHMISLKQENADDDKVSNDDEDHKLESSIRAQCEEFGVVEKITVISHNQIVIIKFVEPTAATNAIQAWHGTFNEETQKRMEALYWDGVTDYTSQVLDEKQEQELQQKEEERHEQFGNWLETQELPPELQLQVEGSS